MGWNRILESYFKYKCSTFFNYWSVWWILAENKVSARPSYTHISRCLCVLFCLEGQADTVKTSHYPSRIRLPREQKTTLFTALLSSLGGWNGLFLSDPGQRSGSHMRVRQSQLQLSVQRHTSHLNKWNGPQKVKCGASLNIKPRITDEMEARSCFISRQPQSASPRSLSGSLGTLPTCSINAHCRVFFVKKRLEETINTGDKMPGRGVCSSARLCCTDTVSSGAACFRHELQQRMSPSRLGRRISVQLEQQYSLSEIWMNRWWKSQL